MSLFDHAHYPASPGHKEDDTSRAAAESMKPSAARLREQCLRALSEFGPMSADECATRLDRSVLSIRPRFTEMLRLGQIEDSGERTVNASNRAAKVWIAL